MEIDYDILAAAILRQQQQQRPSVVPDAAIFLRGGGWGQGGYILGLSHKRGGNFLKYPLPGRGKFFICLNCLKITDPPLGINNEQSLSFYVLFSQYTSCDNTLEKCFFQILINLRAYLRIIYEKKKGQESLGALLGKQNIQAKQVYFFGGCLENHAKH